MRLTVISACRIDSAEHDQARRKECAQINSSLAALKECVRLKASGAHFVPYRKCKLTHILKAAFSENNSTLIVATVSPASKDTEQSLNTLRHACIMDGQVCRFSVNKNAICVLTVSRESWTALSDTNALVRPLAM